MEEQNQQTKNPPQEAQAAPQPSPSSHSGGPADTLTKKQRRALKKQQKRDERKRAERGKKTKTRLAWVGVVGAVALGLWWLVASLNSAGSATVPPANEVVAGDWVKGGADAKAVIIEYSDFQCPACGAYYPIIKQLTEEFGDSVQFAYRHFPLRAIHPNAENAARAAEAAGRQGAFWAMHDLLFERQNEWSRSAGAFDLFAGYAADIGLDVVRFEADYNANAAKDAIRSHEAAGKKLGVNGTPTFVVNGKKVANPAGYDAFRALLVSLVGEPEAQTGLDDAEAATTTQEAL
ncbi:MAG: thioredoxin domain-containing protein [Parcubacteria group bacterium]|nr:thioredoxin domain-containing protein [Parcubacteria group bacterium]